MANTRELMGIQFKNQKELDIHGQQLQLEHGKKQTTRHKWQC